MFAEEWKHGQGRAGSTQIMCVSFVYILGVSDIMSYFPTNV